MVGPICNNYNKSRLSKDYKEFKCYTSMINKIKNYITNPCIRFMYNNKLGLYRNMSDEEFYKKYYRISMGMELNLENPQTYNEKIQWLKLYDRKDLYTQLVDKAEVKRYVADIIGEEYIIPTLGVYDKFEDIDFSTLPDRFVIKVTHDSGGVVICHNKEEFDIEGARKVINKALKRDYYKDWHEWPYKNVPHRIIIEEYIEIPGTRDLPDYKFFAFDGEVKALFIATERQDHNNETKFDFFDTDFNHLDFTNGHPNADVLPAKPEHFDEMLEIAAKLSVGMPHVRVDLYEANGKVYFGELTFAHWSGFVPFNPPEWDYTFGSWIKCGK